MWGFILLLLAGVIGVGGMSFGQSPRADGRGGAAGNLTPIVQVVPVGQWPVGVAVDQTLGLAVVANRDASTVTIIDIARLEVRATIPVNAGPEGVAVDSATHQAVVAEKGNDSVSILDLNTLAVVSTLTVGTAPVGVAFAPNNRAVVTNSGDNTVSLIDVVTPDVLTTVSVGTNPHGVDVDLTGGLAVVANRDSNTVSLVNLSNPTGVTSMNVGNQPEAVAAVPGASRALVTTRNADGTGQVQVLDLSARTVVAEIPAGGDPNGVALSTLSNLAVVASTGTQEAQVLDLAQNQVLLTLPLPANPLGAALYVAGNQALVTIQQADPADLGRLAVIQLPPPQPTITSLDPPDGRRRAGGPSFTLTVNGTKFLTTSVVRADGVPLPTTYVNAQQITAQVPDTLIAEAKTVQISVLTPADNPAISDPTPFVITNPQPSITSISPNETFAGSGGLIINIEGTGFLGAHRGDSVVQFNNTVVRRTRLSSTRLRVILPPSLITQPGNFPITVTNPAPDGGVSNTVMFNVRSDNPAPTVSSIFPESKVVGGGSFVLMVNGINFVNRSGSTSVIRFGNTDLATTFVSRSLLTATVPAALIAATGVVPVTVFNPAPGGGTSNAINFSINNPVPALSALQPASVSLGSGPLAVTVNGTNFLSASVVNFNGSPRATTFVSNRQLRVQLTAADVANVGLFAITVTNPAPGGSTSNPLGLTVRTTGFQAIAQAYPLVGEAPLTPRFIASGFDPGGTIVQYRWDFLGSGTFQTSDDVAQVRTFTYTEPGVYNATLEVVNNRGQRARAVVAITVLPPGLTARALPNNGGAPLAVNFTVTVPSGIRVARYEWDFEGRGVFDYTSTVTGNTSYTYQRIGTFQALLRMTTVAGTIVTQKVTVRVGLSGTPTVVANASVTVGDTPLAVTFNANGSSTPPGTAIVRYEWDFVGDASFPYSSTTTAATGFTYAVPGSYLATLRITNDLGLSSVDQVPIRVNLGASLRMLQDTIDVQQGQTTTVRTTLTAASPVSLRITDRFGGVVRNLVTDAARTAATYNDVWDGKDNAGNAVPGGVYYAVLEYQVEGQARLLDLTAATGYGRFSPSRAPIPGSYNPFANQFIPINLTLGQAAFVDVFIGLFYQGTRFVTLVSQQPLGRGAQNFVWDGLDPNGRVAVPPPGDNFLAGTFAYTLPSNGVIVVAGPQITGASVTPNFFDPSTKLALGPANPTVTITYNLTKTSNVTMQVINMSTQRVMRTLLQPNAPAGQNQVTWDGKDDQGVLVINSDYRIAIQAVDSAGNRSVQLNVVVRVYY